MKNQFASSEDATAAALGQSFGKAAKGENAAATSKEDLAALLRGSLDTSGVTDYRMEGGTAVLPSFLDTPQGKQLWKFLVENYGEDKAAEMWDATLASGHSLAASEVGATGGGEAPSIADIYTEFDPLSPLENLERVGLAAEGLAQGSLGSTAIDAGVLTEVLANKLYSQIQQAEKAAKGEHGAGIHGREAVNAILDDMSKPANDFIVTKSGEVIRSHPDDTIIGTKGGIGGSVQVNIYGGDSRKVYETVREAIRISRSASA